MSSSTGPVAPAAGPLLGPAEIRALAERAGIRPTKTLGQNFVLDGGTVRKIVRQADVVAGERVVEVGPGLGSLTLGLLEVADRVVAVEIDELLAGELPRTVADRMPERADRLDVVTADAMRITALPRTPTGVVANLPYNVAVPVLLHLLATFPE
ncbi:MAG: rRNA adenine N-6-methyltransferase family protein, partial [Cellulomonas sp.]